MKILTLIAVILLIYLIFKYTQHKKIICCYTNTSYFGLGDYIRGIIFSLQKKKFNNKILINYEKHYISKFLYNLSGNNHNYVPDDNKIYKTNERNYDSNTKRRVNYLYNNSMCEYPIKKEIKEYVKNMFVMKNSFKKIFEEELNKLNLMDKFSVLHVRVNDDEINKNINDLNLQKLFDYLENNLFNRNILVLSNNFMAKEYIAGKFGYKYYNIKPTHTGNIGIVGINQEEEIKNTLIEFFTISKSIKIYQYSSDPKQISGFSKRISEIYDIPIVLIHEEL